MLKSAVAKLTNAYFLKKYIPELKISFKGFGMSVSKKDENTDVDTALRNILSHLKKKGKRVLFVIDEVVRNDYVRHD